MSINTFFGFKLIQTQGFNDKGERLALTKIKINKIVIKQVKTKDKDGYWAYIIDVGRGLKKSRKSILREVKLENKPKLKVGDKIKVEDVLSSKDFIKVTGLTKGRGFAGVMKRWGFKGGSRTHGQSDRQRAPGSIGQGTDPGRVWKGKKMPGRMGGKTKTIKNLKVFKVDKENNELWITGLVPGGRGNLVKITKIT